MRERALTALSTSPVDMHEREREREREPLKVLPALSNQVVDMHERGMYGLDCPVHFTSGHA